MSNLHTMSFETILDHQGVALYKNDFLDTSTQKNYFNKLKSSIEWRKDKIKIFGKELPIPRYQAWYGDEGAKYKYSNLQLIPNPWISPLIEIKHLVSNICETEFNSCLVNLYETGNDYAAHHADNEKELGINPTIASVSLGGERIFHLKNNISKKLIKLSLEPGSLLLMKGELQHHWTHQLPKTKKNVDPRINLTFRKIVR